MKGFISTKEIYSISWENNKMKKIFYAILITSLVLVLVPVSALAHTAEDPYVTDLTAGGGNIKSAKDVGDVLVWNDGKNLYVKYVVTDEEWCLTETHLEVATALQDIPQVNGNPPPGQFTYKGEHDCVAGVEYTIPLTWDSGTELLIAAHGVVQTGGMGGVGATLPEQVTIAITHPGLAFGAPSYFDIAVSGGTTLDGTYDGYCIDNDGGPVNGTANVFSSYEPLPQSRIEYPENLDLVNWIINQDFVGQLSTCGGAYTYGDVQWAIWQLLEDNPHADHVSLGEWSLCRAQEILAAAYANGEGFVPGCGEVLGIVLIMEQYWWNQPILIWIEVPCEEDETVWGGDYFGSPLEFPGNNWAIYFEYTVQESIPPDGQTLADSGTESTLSLYLPAVTFLQ
jgi:hypothetical protein